MVRNPTHCNRNEGQLTPEIFITLTNNLICAKDFLRVHLFLPKVSLNINGLKFFTPPKYASEIFGPPFTMSP